MREEIDSDKSKIDLILETMLALARREEEVHNVVVVRDDVPVQGPTPHSRPAVHVPNPMIYGFPLGYTLPFEGVTSQSVNTSGVTYGVVAQGPPVDNQIPIHHTDEELQDEYEMQNYHGVTPVVSLVAALYFEAIQICRALAEKLRAMEGYNSTSLSALDMYLIPDMVIPPKLKASELVKYKGFISPNIHMQM